MKRALPAHVYQKPKGLYFQRRGWKTVKINSVPGTKEFALEYAAILNGALVAPQTAAGRTFAALIQSYHASPRYKGLAPRTARDYDKVLVWIKSKLGALDVAGMQRKDVIRARDANAETVRFANYIVQVLRILFEHGIDQGWREDNPAKGVSLLKSGAPPREAWPQDMIDAYRAKATGRALLIFELALGTGQRIGDVLKMRWSDIEGDGINVTQGKTGARLWVGAAHVLSTTLGPTRTRHLPDLLTIYLSAPRSILQKICANSYRYDFRPVGRIPCGYRSGGKQTQERLKIGVGG
ncbi:tyrosine recombinase XerC [Rhodobacter sp. 24-YEA-8]|uniref:site-specific integrase n=1 Tax=Rhodobacter sp. 24-YEA-8 TaxID=1884310 RepID=UPI000898E447|nr:tyrosine-type recombinase/integrase [Rhodobacter sp. 24-YEA-8]SEB61032.1 Phage integrase family protein [Rhodobacter sp. 24-YEA-8]